MFLQRIGSFLLALGADFLRFVLPQTPPSSQEMKEEKTMDQDLQAMTVFINVLRAHGNREAYKKLVDAAQAAYQPMTTQNWIELFSKVDSAVRRGSPGHDFGHSRRDVLAAFALASDKQLAGYQPAEIVAGMFAGMFHDLGTAYVPRYKDFETIFGHAEDGAWRLYQLLHGLVEENLLLLVCYAIASHTHYTEAKNCKDKSVRQPWYYELFEEDGKKYGWAVLACRFADRLDTNGSTLMLRHFLANADALESGGQDLSGKTFYDINQDSIRIMVTPKKTMMDTSDGKKAPTTIQHVFNFAGSNFGNSVYSVDDHLFPTMSRLMGYKVAQSMNIAVIGIRPNSAWEKAKVALGFENPIENLRRLLFRASRSPRFSDAWAVLNKAFSALTADELSTWSRITDYLNSSYDMLLEAFKLTILENKSVYTDPILPLIDGIIAEIS